MLIETKSCNRCHETLPVAAFWRNQAMKDGFNSSCKQCNKASGGSFPKDIHPSRLNWDQQTQYSTRPPLQSVYNAVCLQAGHVNGTWSLTTAQAKYVRFMGLKRCAQCNGWCELQEDSDGLRGAGVQRHESPGKARTEAHAA